MKKDLPHHTRFKVIELPETDGTKNSNSRNPDMMVSDPGWFVLDIIEQESIITRMPRDQYENPIPNTVAETFKVKRPRLLIGRNEEMMTVASHEIEVKNLKEQIDNMKKSNDELREYIKKIRAAIQPELLVIFDAANPDPELPF